MVMVMMIGFMVLQGLLYDDGVDNGNNGGVQCEGDSETDDDHDRDFNGGDMMAFVLWSCFT